MHQIFIQHMTNKIFAPKAGLLRKWAKAALGNKEPATEVTLRIVGVEEMTHLNSTYRNKPGATNVLSFPFSMPEMAELDIHILGDIVICADIVNREATEQSKSSNAHWAHMVVHGILHLLGYDHIKPKEADVMEGLEVDILLQLGFPNPYQPGANIKNHG